jgi:phosphoserine phosphatase
MDSFDHAPGVNVRAVAFDFDGTLAVQSGGWTLLHELYGTTAEGDERTVAYRNDQLTFEGWCQGNVADWRDRGVTEADIERAADALKLTTGADALLQWVNEQELPFGVLSAGITDLMAPVQRYNPAFTVSNDLRFDGGRLAGVDPTVGPDDKGDLLEAACADLGVTPSEMAYVGDSHTDVEAFEVAGYGILFDPDSRFPDSGYELVDEVYEERDLRHVRDALADLLD